MAEETRDDTELDSTVAMAHRCYRESRDHSSEWRMMSPKWYDLVANRQWDKDDIDALEEHDRLPVVINRVARTINAIIGTQVNNRQETRFIPREEGDVKPNELLTGAADWVRDGCDAEDEESDAFEDTTVCGMGWTETRLNYEQDPEGTITVDRIDPLEMYWDPNAKKRNLADARWIMRIKPVPRDEFNERWPDAGGSVLSDPWEGAPDNLQQREHVYPQEAYEKTQGTSQRAVAMKPRRVAQIQWAEREPMYRVGKAAERISAEAFKALKDKLDAEKIPYMKQTGTRWKQAFICGGQVLEEGDAEAPDKGKSDDCPYPDGPTLRCITYKRDRNHNTWYGVVAAMMDPQKYGNKFLSLIMDILRANSKGGVMIEKGAVDDPKEIENKWAKPDALVFVNAGALTGGKIQERPKAQLPAGLDRLVAYFLDSVHEVTGINLELLGMANREQAGVLENTRKQAGVTIIAPLFDGLRRYRKEQGRVLLYFIQTYLSDGRLVRINGQQGQQYVPLAKQPDTAKYDVIVDEAPTSPNMKERVFGSLIEILPHLLKTGIPIPPSIVKYGPFPSSLVEEWQKLIESSAGAPDPEAIEKMQGELQKLTEENQKLRLGKEEKMMELQMDQQKMQAEMQLEREKMMAELEIERIKAQNDIQIAREKAQTDMQLQQEKLGADVALKQGELHQKARLQGLEMEMANPDAVGQISGGIDGLTKSMAEFTKRKPKRRVRVVRDRAGELVGAEVEDD